MSSKKSSKKQTKTSTEQRPAKHKKIVSLAEYEADKKAGGTSAATTADVGAGSKKSAKAKEPAKKHTPSGLDAAAAILADAKAPLTTGEMVEKMLAKGLWKTNGKTPAATIYAAIIREIATKGSDSRFRKAERGKFSLKS